MVGFTYRQMNKNINNPFPPMPGWLKAVLWILAIIGLFMNERVTLCEKCFPVGENEVFSTAPHGPCDECGEYYDRNISDIKCYTYPSDPRI